MTPIGVSVSGMWFKDKIKNWKKIVTDTSNYKEINKQLSRTKFSQNGSLPSKIIHDYF